MTLQTKLYAFVILLFLDCHKYSYINLKHPNVHFPVPWIIDWCNYVPILKNYKYSDFHHDSWPEL